LGKVTNISWTDSTLNLAWGCKKISPGCAQCYMFRLSKQFGKDPDNVSILVDNYEKFKKKIKTMGKRIFINSMSDTFHSDIPDSLKTQWIGWMGLHPEHQFQLLTKRANEMAIFCNNFIKEYGDLPNNVWFGVSIESPEYLWRAHSVRGFPGPNIRFISFEPLLSDIFANTDFDLNGIDWVIVGGESDYKNPRIMNPLWALNILDQCKKYEIPFFYKQQGGFGGDGAGGCLLLGKEYKEFPL